MAGEWNYSSGKWHGDPNDKGIQTSEDYRFYSISVEFPMDNTLAKDEDGDDDNDDAGEESDAESKAEATDDGDDTEDDDKHVAIYSVKL
ncbi:hypothetical protein FNV43_RR05475 [Rhamnella rubrinervis]|uniref:Calreticulin n=1 Tax=Rhamnella rubrinervis TaxID=2594499 RepID=A0A8K0HLF5_9ROSA|nr:hypothetical protein FNV43_RR05475 [Rhamnella rubrinervis]